MIRSKLFLLLTIAAVALCAPLPAATLTNAFGPPLMLGDVARLLGDQNPRLAADREAIAAARAGRLTAGAYPNPKLSMNHQEPGGQSTLFTGTHQEQVGVELPILIPGQRSARIAKADADIAAARARVSANTTAFAADACLSFARLLALQERSAAFSNSLAEVAGLRQKISGRADQGAASAYDLARVDVELGLLSSRLENARSEMAAESSQLAALLNITNQLPSAAGSLAPWNLPAQSIYDISSETASAPLVVAANREAAAASAGIKSARRERWPDLSIGGGRAWTRHPYGSADYVALSIEIPIFDSRRGQLEKARSDARAAEARKAAALAETEASIRQLSGTVQRRQAALERYRTDVEPRLARLKEMSSDAYILGRHTLLELLDAEQTRREAILEHIETTASLVEAQIRFLAASGRLLPYLQETTPNP